MKNSQLLIRSIPLVLIAACSDGGRTPDPNRPETLGADQAAVRIAVTGKATRVGATLTTVRTLKDGSRLAFTEVHVGLSKVIVGSAAQTGSFDVDLLANTSKPDLSAMVTTAGRYNQVRVKRDQTLAGGYSAIVRGTWTPAGGGTAVPFEFRSRRAREIALVNAVGFEVQARVLSNVIVAFDVDKWFSNLDLSQAHRGADGSIHLGDDSNTGLADDADDDDEQAGECGEDHDHNGRLSGGESGRHECTAGAAGAGGMSTGAAGAGGDPGAAGAGVDPGAAGASGGDQGAAGAAGDQGAAGAGAEHDGEHDDGDHDDGDHECGDDDRDGGGIGGGEHDDGDDHDGEHGDDGAAGAAGSAGAGGGEHHDGDDHDDHGAGGAGGAAGDSGGAAGAGGSA